MTDEVAALVLEDRRLQALSLSIAGGRRYRGDAVLCPRLIDKLEERGQLDPQDRRPRRKRHAFAPRGRRARA